MHESKRYLGIDLAGAKNHKTVVAVLEYYPTENKIFLLDIFERVGNDESLLELVEELNPSGLEIGQIGVNVPLDIPVCIPCTRKICPTQQKCNVPSVKWMRDTTRKTQKSQNAKPQEFPKLKVLDFTPYTQRAVELWIRYHVMSKLPQASHFEVDEALGGNKAPLTARMHYLRRHLGKVPLTEVWPKLSVAILAEELGIQKRHVAKYRQLEEGIHSREEMLEELAHKHGLFIYERDVRKLSQSLGAFDAFICAYTALLADTDRCVEEPHGFPSDAGWISFPKFISDER